MRNKEQPLKPVTFWKLAKEKEKEKVEAAAAANGEGGGDGGGNGGCGDGGGGGVRGSFGCAERDEKEISQESKNLEAIALVLKGMLEKAEVGDEVIASLASSDVIKELVKPVYTSIADLEQQVQRGEQEEEEQGEEEQGEEEEEEEVKDYETLKSTLRGSLQEYSEAKYQDLAKTLSTIFEMRSVPGGMGVCVCARARVCVCVSV